MQRRPRPAPSVANAAPTSAQRNVRTLAIAGGCCRTAEAMLDVLLAVWAYQRGGAGLVAIVASSIFLPATVVTPAAVILAERSIRREVALRRITLLFALLAGATGLAVATETGAAIVIVLAATGLSAGTAFRPVSSSLLLWVARTPAELIKAHAWATSAEKAGGVVGPVLAAICIATSGPAFGAFVAAGVLLVASGLTAGVHAEAQRADHRTVPGVTNVVRAITDGASVAVRPPGLVVFVLLRGLVMSALDVMIVLTAFDLLGGSGGSVGWLQAALGAGGMLGGAIAARLLRNAGTGRSVALATALLAVPLLMLGGLRQHALVFAAIAIAGLADSLVDVALRSALPRAFGLIAIARVTAAVEVVAQLSITGGAVVATLALHVLDRRGSLALLGGTLAVGAAAFWAQMKRLDAGLPLPGAALQVMRKLPMFSPMPMAVMEAMSSHLLETEYCDGAIVLAEGDPGDDYHVILSGEAVASAGGTDLRTMGPGDGFGEIALLRDVPRTATVTARGHLRTLRLGREPFLAAVIGQHDAFAAASLVAEERLRHG